MGNHMVGMAKTPKASWDKTSNRFLINWRFPKAVSALTGPFFRDRFPRSLSPKQAAAREAERLSEFFSIIDAAAQRIGTLDGRIEAIRNTMEPKFLSWRSELAERESALDEAAAALASKKSDVLFYKLAAERGIAIERVPSHRAIDTEAVVEAWIVERRDILRKPPKEKAIERKRQVIREMLAATKRSHFGAITEGDLRLYHGMLGKSAYDHLSELKPLFRRAHAVGLIDVNPFVSAIDKMPPKVRGKRPMFLDDEAKAILSAAALSDDPVIKFANVIAAHSGAINSEILEAHAAEFFQNEQGVWVWDMRGRVLKTAARPRVLPLHPAIIDSGFLPYLDTRRNQALFEGKAEWNSNRLNLWLDGFGDKTFYSWRHRVLHSLDKLIKAGKTTDSLNKFIQGHAGSTIAEKHYHHHELPEEFPNIIVAINSL